MLTIEQIINIVKPQQVSGGNTGSVQGLCMDSRMAAPGFLFAAIKGHAQDGHDYIESALKKGVTVVVCSERVVPQSGVCYLYVINPAEAIAHIAHAFYDRPSEKLRLVGVTGTNGKTTVATLLYQLFKQLGYTCGLVSTVQNMVDDEKQSTEHTTPDAISLNSLLAQMVRAGCSHAFMEVSSHAIHQHRIAGLQFAGGLFTNITHDHLDYHQTFEEYIRVKKSFFDSLPKTSFAITNADEKRGMVMLQNTNAKCFRYALKTPADFKGKILENNLTGLIMDINGREVHFRMIGEFNAYNLLSVFGAAKCLGEDDELILEKLSWLKGAEGRFDYTLSERDQIIGIVDYAHTPDALLNVLATIKKLKAGNGQLITVVGCGGDRDKAKRPLMAGVACEYSEKAILTSDNPRTEDPLQILNDMQQDMKSEHKRKCLVIADRREAIKTAVMLAMPGDIVLIAGKGHEKYQDIMGVKSHFDDKEELLKNFSEQQK